MCCMIILFYRLQALELGLRDFSGFVIDVLQIIRFVFNFCSPSPKTVSRKQVSSISCEHLGISWDAALVTSVVYQISNRLILVPEVYRIPKNNNMGSEDFSWLHYTCWFEQGWRFLGSWNLLQLLVARGDAWGEPSGVSTLLQPRCLSHRAKKKPQGKRSIKLGRKNIPVNRYRCTHWVLHPQYLWIFQNAPPWRFSQLENHSHVFLSPKNPLAL